MTGFDFSPLFRTAIGFDRLARIADSAAASSNQAGSNQAGSNQARSNQGYPPYNIERIGEEDYRLTMAVAGFRPEDIDITAQDNTLVITGRVRQEAVQGQMLHRGIAARGFERRFALADHLVVEGADLRDGLLHVALKRVIPEALKPRRIAIGGVGSSAIGGDAPAAIANDSAAGNEQAA